MADQDAAFWDKIAAKYARDPISNPAAYQETLDLIRAEIAPDGRVLELGCSTGSTALDLAPGSARYVGTDFSGKMIAIARGKLGAGAPENLSFEVAQATALPKGPFDKIVALNLLHLVRDLPDLLDRSFDTLPRGGALISKTPLLGDGNWLLRIMVPAMRAVGKAPYVRFLKRGAFEQALTHAGFNIESTLLQPGMVPRLFVVARKPSTRKPSRRGSAGRRPVQEPETNHTAARAARG